MQNEKLNAKKPLFLLLSVLMAVSIWVYVDETNDRTIEQVVADIPVEYTNESALTNKGLMVLEKETSQTIDVKFSGRRRLVSWLDQSKIRMTVDLANIESSGVQSIRPTLKYTDQDSDRFTTVRYSFSPITVNISELNSNVVEIRCDVTGHLADGYSAGVVRLSQEMLEIRGLAKDIDPVSYAKVILDIGENVTETVSKSLTFQFYNEKDELIENDAIYPTVDEVQATLPVYVTKELDLVVNFKEAPGARAENLVYTIDPPTITVSGDASLLKNMNSIVLDEFDLMQLVGEGRYVNTYSIILPEGCQNLSGVTRASMEIRFRDISSAEITADQINYTNLPSDKEAEILTQELMVSVFGTSEDVAAVTSEDLIVTADLSQYSAASGVYTVPVTVSVKGTGDIGVVGTYEVQVAIREPVDTGEEPSVEE